MACGTHARGEGRIMYRLFVGKSEGERPLRRPRRRWEVGIRMGLRYIDCGVREVDSTGSGYESLAGYCECCDEPSGPGATELVKVQCLRES
jgi:hypothetical protein